MNPKIHPDRYTRTGVHAQKNGVVIHDAETPDNAAEGLLAAFLRPGDRVSDNGTPYGSSYHAVTDGAGGYIAIGDGAIGPYHAPPVNKNFWSVCMPGRAAQTRDEWMDAVSRSHILGAARYIVDRWHDDGQRWPLEFADAARLVEACSADPDVAKRSSTPVGYTSHKQISDAWRKSDHWDPGPSFPWDVLAADIAELAGSPVNRRLTTPDASSATPAATPSETPSPTPQPDTPKEVDMRELIQVLDDAAVLMLWGNVCTTVREEAVIDFLVDDGILADKAPRPIHRSSLKMFELRGEPPSYESYAGPLPGRTVATDFALWVH